MKNAFLQLSTSRKKSPMAFVLLMTMGKSFFAAQSCTLGTVWIYNFDDPAHRWVNGLRAAETALAKLEDGVRKWHSSERPLRSSEPNFALNQLRLSNMVVCKSCCENKGNIFSIEKDSFKLGIILRPCFLSSL